MQICACCITYRTLLARQRHALPALLAPQRRGQWLFFKGGPNLLEQLVVLRLVSVPDGGNRRQTFRELGLLPEKVHQERYIDHEHARIPAEDSVAMYAAAVHASGFSLKLEARRALGASGLRGRGCCRS